MDESRLRRHGPELELLLVNNDGTVSGRAANILAQTSDEYAWPEFTNSWIEIGAVPSNTILPIAESVVATLSDLITQSAQYGVIPTPISTTIAKDHHPISQLSERVLVRSSLFYGTLSDDAAHCLGSHCHVEASLDPEKELRQLQMTHAADIFTAFMSSSPFFDGVYDGNNPRTRHFRDISNEEISAAKGLCMYPPSLQSYDTFLELLYQEMRTEASKRGFDPDIIAADRYANIAGPVKRHKQEGKNTIEHRAVDAANPSLLMADVTALKAYHAAVVEGGMNVRLDGDLNTSYTQQNGHIILPSYELLKKIEKEKSLQGPASDAVYGLMQKAYALAEYWTKPEEKHWLQPWKQILEVRMNDADHLLAYASRQEMFIPGTQTLKDGAQKELRLYAAEKFLRDFDGLQEKTTGLTYENRRAQPYRHGRPPAAPNSYATIAPAA